MGQRGDLLGLAALERHGPDLLVAQEERAVALRREPWRRVAHVAHRERPHAASLQRRDPDVAAIALCAGDPARVERVAPVRADCGTPERDLAEHELARRERHPAGQHTAGISLIIAILLALFILPSPWGLVVVLCAGVLEVFEITWGIRLARRRSSVGAHTLIGREAVVVRELDPVGQVTIDGERWQARAATGAAVGARVVIERIDGLTLEVRVKTF
jgi:membrane protein implicated in regulation of membrane protease activity